MSAGCLPIFGRERSSRNRGSDDENSVGISQVNGRSSLNLFSLILRKDSGLTNGSTRSNSSSTSSISTRMSAVSFNPQIEQMHFDKNEAPNHIRGLIPTKSSCPGILSSAQRVNAVGPFSRFASGRRVERRHSIVQ